MSIAYEKSSNSLKSSRVMCSSIQYLRKYGRAIKTIPIRIIRNMLETKYGKAHSTTPDRRAIPRRCLLPYIK
jgi:hypothetical protein